MIGRFGACQLPFGEASAGGSAKVSGDEYKQSDKPGFTP